MARTPKPKENDWEVDAYSYRGRKVAIHKHGDHVHYRLFIDDREIELEQTEQGVIAHEAMYQVFGSPYELAEALIQDWGAAKIEHSAPPHHPPHNH